MTKRSDPVPAFRAKVRANLAEASTETKQRQEDSTMSDTNTSNTNTTPAKKNRKKGNRWLVPTIIIGAVGVSVFALLNRPGPTGQLVKVTNIKEGLFEKVVNGTGSAKAEVSRSLSFNSTGKVENIYVKVGDRVEAGQTLAKLDTAALERDLAAARSSVAAAKAEVNRAKVAMQENQREITRNIRSARLALQSAQAHLRENVRLVRTQNTLYQVGGISASELQTAKRNRDEAARKVTAAQDDLLYAQNRNNKSGEAAILQAQSNLESAVVRQKNVERSLQQAELRAPTAGLVSTVNITAGNMAPSGQSALEITDPSRLYLEVAFDETRATNLKRGQPATIEFDALPTQTIQGTVDRVEPTARSSGQVASVLVKIRMRDAGDVKPGFTGTAKVITRRIREAKLVPLEVTGEEKGKTQVWVVQKGEMVNGKQQGTATAKSIQILDRNANHAVIEGLNQNELLLTPYPSKMTAGDEVLFIPKSTQAKESKVTPER